MKYVIMRKVTIELPYIVEADDEETAQNIVFARDEDEIRTSQYDVTIEAEVISSDEDDIDAYTPVAKLI